MNADKIRSEKHPLPAPAEGGAGSKRIVLGCDPGAGCGAEIARVLTCASTVTSPETGAPAPRFGAPPPQGEGVGGGGSRWSGIISVYLRLSAVAVLLFAACVGPAAAQEKPARGRVSVEELKVRSDAGDKSAARQLAEMYYLGRGGVEQNFGEAARWYEQLARQGDARAQTSLGLMYARGLGVEKNLQTAHKWWLFAAAQNDPGAQYNLGVIYSRGEGIAQDPAQAAQWLTRAAQRGHVQAQHNLGMLYYEGKGLERDLVRAYFWLKVAALQGDDVARDALKAAGKDLSADQIRLAEGEAAGWMQKYKKTVGQ